MEYYLTLAGVLIIGIPITMGVLGYLWNRKWRPRQNARGIPVDRFGNIVKRGMKFAFKEDPGTLAPKKASPKLKKLLRLKNVYLLGLIIAAAFLALQEILIPFIIVFAIVLTIWIRAHDVFKVRHNILTRMFEVANSQFRYDRGAELNPWKYVQISGWEGLKKPLETTLTFPTKWKADTYAARDGFESHFNSAITDENTWTYDWQVVEGKVTCKPVNKLPTRADYTGSQKYDWSVFPLGVGAEGVVSYDVMTFPHVLIAGTTGSGKSVLQRNLLFHCIQHNDQWRFVGVDVKQVELTPFLRYSKTVMGVGTDVSEGLEIVKFAHEIMTGRYTAMKASGVNHFMKTEDPDRPGKTPYALMVMIDEAFAFLAPKGGSSDAAKAENEMKGEASGLISDLARLGRAAGVFLVIATQRPDATVITGELKNNLDVRIAAGRLDATPSSMVLDSGAATNLPGNIRGRGVVRYAGATQEFQGFFAEQNWIDDWLREHPGVEPDLDAELNPGYVETPDPGSDMFEKEFREETGLLEDTYLDPVEAKATADAIDEEIEQLDRAKPLRVEEVELDIPEEQPAPSVTAAKPVTFADMPYAEFYNTSVVDLDAPLQDEQPGQQPSSPQTPSDAGKKLPTRPAFPARP